MTQMGKYCKAYHLYQLRDFSGWNENVQSLKKKKDQVDGREMETERELREKDIFYVQENYMVTDEIFIDENIIFDNVTPEWKGFCRNVLQFEIPFRESATIESAQEGNQKSQ